MKKKLKDFEVGDILIQDGNIRGKVISMGMNIIMIKWENEGKTTIYLSGTFELGLEMGFWAFCKKDLNKSNHPLTNIFK